MRAASAREWAVRLAAFALTVWASVVAGCGAPAVQLGPGEAAGERLSQPEVPEAPATRTSIPPALAYVEFSVSGQGFDRAGNDNRELAASCGSCGARLETRLDTCPKPDCNAKLRWPKTIKCKFCCPEADLKFEGVEQCESKSGFCAHCRGSGKKTTSGKGPDYIAFGISRSGGGAGARRDKCRACKGSGGCRWCKGNGWITVADYFD